MTILPRLQVVKTNETSPETLSTLMSFGKDMGKVAIQCSDTPGFVVNRLLVPNIAEAIRMLERGGALKKMSLLKCIILRLFYVHFILSRTWHQSNQIKSNNNVDTTSLMYLQSYL